MLPWAGEMEARLVPTQLCSLLRVQCSKLSPLLAVAKPQWLAAPKAAHTLISHNGSHLSRGGRKIILL